MKRTYKALLVCCTLLFAFSSLCLPALGATEGSLAETNPVGFVFLCLGVGIALAGIAILIIVLRYRMKIRKTIYPLDKYAALSLTHKEDFYTTTTTTRTRISSSSDNKRGGR